MRSWAGWNGRSLSAARDPPRVTSQNEKDRWVAPRRQNPLPDVLDRRLHLGLLKNVGSCRLARCTAASRCPC